MQRDGLRLVEVVVDDDRDGDLVAAGQGDGQVEIDEERLEDPDRRLRAAERPSAETAPAVSRQVVIESARSTSRLARAPGRR